MKISLLSVSPIKVFLHFPAKAAFGNYLQSFLYSIIILDLQLTESLKSTHAYYFFLVYTVISEIFWKRKTELNSKIGGWYQSVDSIIFTVY